MDKKELQAIAQAAAKNIKTEDDLYEFRQMLTKITVETALNVELDDHIGYDDLSPKFRAMPTVNKLINEGAPL
jgi:putative transposase